MTTATAAIDDPRHKCARCQGEGYEEYEEDGRWVRDACYHCGTAGYVDDDTHFHDRIHSAAATLADMEVSAMRRARNQDPDGEGWDFCAAENMMTGHDYYAMYVYQYTDVFAQQIAEMDLPDQELLVAWNELRREYT
jgi:hypothetical protein